MARVTEKSAVIDAILDVLAVGAVVGTILVAPNVAQIIAKIHNKRTDKHTLERESRATLYYMKRQGVVEIVEADDQMTIRITNKGRARLAQHKFASLSIPRPSKWDGKWRMVMFDIPQRHDLARRAVTAKLKMLGFKLLQRSVWVHPFPCANEIKAIKGVFPEIAPYLLVAEADDISAHRTLLKLFAPILKS